MRKLVTATFVLLFVGCSVPNAGRGPEVKDETGFFSRINPVAWKIPSRRRAKRPSAQSELAWVSGIPANVPRANLITPIIDGESLAQVTVEPLSYVSQVSSGSTGLVLESVNGIPVTSLDELLMPLDGVDEIDLKVRPVAPDGGVTNHGQQTVRVATKDFPALAQLVAKDVTVTKTQQSGRPAAIIRQGQIRCAISPRLDRTTGLVQVVVHTTNLWGPSRLVPAEVKAKIGGRELACLKLSETLELLYGKGLDTAKAERSPFSMMSEQNEYLLATNFQALEEKFNKKETSTSRRPRPQLIDLPDYEFPGSALLADSRALSMFMMRRELLNTGADSEGWVMFHTSELSASEITIEIDFGDGLVPVVFSLP